MAEAALDILDQFLHASDAEVRRKGVAALAALESSDAGPRLVEAALHDADPEVRASAEKSIAGIPAGRRGAVDAELEQQLRDRKSEREVYALLGRLKLQGYRSEVRLGTWPRRLRRAFGFFGAIKRGGGWRWWRGIWPTLFGVLIALSIFVGLAVADVDYTDDPSRAFLAVLFAMGLTARTAPTERHFDRLAGVAVDVLFVFLGLLPAWLLAVSGVHGAEQQPLLVTVTGVAVLFALVAATRGVAALTAGMIQIPFVGAFVRVGASAFTALVITAALLALASGVSTANPSGLWTACWLLAFALAVPFVIFDRASAPIAGESGYKLGRAVLGGAWGLGLASLLVVTIAPRLVERAREITDNVVLADNQRSATKQISRTPAAYGVAIRSSELRLISIEARRASGGDSLRIQLRRQGKPPGGRPANTVLPIALEEMLLEVVLNSNEATKQSVRTIRSGYYTLHVTQNLEDMPLLDIFLARLQRSFSRTADLDPEVELSLRLDDPPRAD